MHNNCRCLNCIRLTCSCICLTCTPIYVWYARQLQMSQLYTSDMQLYMSDEHDCIHLQCTDISDIHYNCTWISRVAHICVYVWYTRHLQMSELYTSDMQLYMSDMHAYICLICTTIADVSTVYVWHAAVYVWHARRHTSNKHGYIRYSRQPYMNESCCTHMRICLIYTTILYAYALLWGGYD